MKSLVLLAPAVVLAASGLLMPAPAGAEDENPTTYERRRATLPWPAADKAFTFEGQFLMGDNPMGSVKLVVAPREGVPGWSVTQTIEMAGGAMRMGGTTLFDAKLTPLSGTLEQKGPKESITKTWKTTQAGVEFTTVGDATPRPIAHEGPFLTSMTSVLLFCRLIDFAEGTYEATILDEDKETFVGTSWSCEPAGMWNGTKARLVKGERADGKRMEAGFDAATGALLGVKLIDGERLMAFRPGEAPKLEANYFDSDATSAKQAALQAALSFSTADFELLERIVHWPSVHAHLTAANPDPELTEDKLKAQLMTQFRSTLKPQGTREALAPFLQAMAGGLTVSGDEQETLVKFGPNFRNLQLLVGKRDGTWKLVRLPGT